MKSAVAGLVALLLIISLLPMMRREAWWIRVFDFPRLQILALSLVAGALAIAYWGLGTWSGAAVVGAAFLPVLIQATSIRPYTGFARQEVLAATEPEPASTVSLLVANVLMRNRRADRLLSLIAEYQPDVVLLLEPDGWWAARMHVLEEEGYAHVLKEPLDNRYGMLLYSRLPLLESRIVHLLREEIPSMHARVRLRGGDEVWLHALHPEPPSPTEADTSVPRDVELLLVGREVKGRDAPTIVAGDLNDVAWSYTTTLFQRVSGLLDPRKGRGMFNTFNAKIPLVRWPLDHVFHSDHFALVDLQRLPAFGSDHFPVYVRLALRPAVAAVQQEPRANQADRAAARAKLAQAAREER
ncbi:endonuclease/exonuclease/phosphatase family protein [Ectothiorhodospiraceae bacterium 2226]|nr:endonuclease/exonuclease/phosphatase family protein [Ectothiorhodospiraceae bacterium 2226]